MVVGPKEPERLPRAPGKAHVCSEGKRDVDVEDSLTEALIGVVGNPVERQRNRADQQRKGGDRKCGACTIP